MDLIQEQFVKAIADNPRDWATRKIYADWLDDHDQPEEADKQRDWNDKKQDSWEWLEQFAAKGGNHCADGYGSLNEDSYIWRDIVIEDLIDAGNLFLDTGATWIQIGDETLRSNLTYPKSREEFWKHFENVTGRKVGDKKDERPFSCSC